MIQRAAFGSTGHFSSRILFGAAALAEVSQKDADKTLETLIQYGINHIDTAASYGDAEMRIGPWMSRDRENFFLATKTNKRTYKEAKEELDESRRRLQSDVIDLWQMHFLVDEADWQTAMGPDGALKAFIEAKEKGIVRHLGVTGHGLQAPLFHLRSLEKYPFDAVLCPWNYPLSLDREYRDNFGKLKEICQQKGIALQTIKSICRRPWPESLKNRDTWYQPLEDQDAIYKAAAFVLSDPQLFLNSVGDIHILPRLLKGAQQFFENPSSPPTEQEMTDLMGDQKMESLFSRN